MLVLDSDLDIPLYIQLYRHFVEKISNGELKASARLPSSRKLCEDLHISRNTVDLAYQQLCAEGYVASKPRSGYYVEKLDFSSVHPSARSHYVQTSSIKNSPTVKYDFKYGKLNIDDAPIIQWQKLLNKAMNNFKDEMTIYGPTFGNVELRKEILKYLRYYRGVDCSVDQIFIGAGVHYCLGMMCQFLGNDVTVAMEDPGYHVTRATFRNHGFAVKPISLDSCGLNVANLRASEAKVAYVTPSHQYPLGIIMPISRRLELIEWAVQSDSIIIEDDYSCHLRYNTNPVQSLQFLCPEKVVYVGSFSKFLFPSARLSYMVLPENMLEKFTNMFDGYPSSVSHLIQKTMELFMQQGYWESYLRKSKRIQKKKHDSLIKMLTEEFGENISIYGMNAGLHIMVEVKNGMYEADLIGSALNAGVKVYPTSKFWENPENGLKSAVVLGFGGIEMDYIEPAVKLLRKAWIK